MQYTATTSVGNYAIFAGYGSNSTTTVSYAYGLVDAFNGSLTYQTLPSLSVKRTGMGATTVGDYALFGGGWTEAETNGVANMETFDSSLTMAISTNLSEARISPLAATVGSYALFASGYNYTQNENVFIANNLTTVDVYTA